LTLSYILLSLRAEPYFAEEQAMNGKMVKVHLYSQSEPVEIKNVLNTYQKGDLFCVFLIDKITVYKFPVQHIFRITEVSATK